MRQRFSAETQVSPEAECTPTFSKPKSERNKDNAGPPEDSLERPPVEKKQAFSTAIQDQDAPAREVDTQRIVHHLVAAFFITISAVIGTAAVTNYISQFCNTPCAEALTNTSSLMTATMKTLLVATHLYNFPLVSGAMFVSYKRITSLQSAGARSPFTALLGLSYIMVATMAEIGWHLNQDWFYKEEYVILNLAFYVSLISGLSLWATGIQLRSEVDKRSAMAGVLDAFLLAAPVLTGGLYLWGAAVIHSKLPIYFVMFVVLGRLTWNLYKLLDNNPWVLGFPFFSMVVNLAFIFLLKANQADLFLNPLYHILHDALGTELGFAWIAVMMYITPYRTFGME